MVVALALGGFYTLVQAASSGWQLATPRLSFEVQSQEIPAILPYESVIVPLNFAVRNEGFWSSAEVDVLFKLDRGNMSDQYAFVLSRQLFSMAVSKQSEVYGAYDSNGPLGSTFTALPPDGFIVKIPSVPPLSEMLFSFNVTTLSAFPGLSSKIAAQVDVQSAYPVAESTPTYRSQSVTTQFQFVAYALGTIVILAAGVVMRNQWVGGTKSVQTRTVELGRMHWFRRRPPRALFPFVILFLASGALITWYQRTRAFQSFSQWAMNYQAQHPDLPVGLPTIHATLLSDQFCLGPVMGCVTWPPYSAIFAVLEALLIVSVLLWAFSSRRD